MSVFFTGNDSSPQTDEMARNFAPRRGGRFLLMTTPPRTWARGLGVSAEGRGCMSMGGGYGPADDREGVATIQRALDLGVTFLDTADVYGLGHNEELVGRAIAGRRDRV